jgi:creatinine amidohydrolase/Fe(II)-dependent formamide hydrolase-like protein
VGFKAGIFVTGHYGPNWEDLKQVLELLQPHVGMRLYGLPDFEANQPGFDPAKPGNGGDHAGRVETSLLWALEPECVDVSRIPDRKVEGKHFAMGHNAREADRRVGERMVRDEVAWLGDKARELLAAYDRAQPTARLRTFDQVEQLWDTVIRPHVKDFKCMSWRGKEPDIPADSIWSVNCAIPERS